jgi:hypothetical protein
LGQGGCAGTVLRWLMISAGRLKRSGPLVQIHT